MLKFLASAAAVSYAADKGYAKDLGKGLGVAGALFFASGLGVAGFNAFDGVSSIGDFLGAVGKTTMAGAQGLLGAVGVGSGVSQNLANSLGVNQGATLFNSGTSTGTGGFTGLSGIDMARQTQSSLSSASGGSGSTSSNMLNNFFGGINTSNAIGQAQNKAMLMSAIQTGAQAWLAHRQYKRKEEQTARLNFFGDRARGGSPELPFEVPSVMSSNSNKDNRDIVGSPSMPSPFDEDEEKDNDTAMPGFMRGSI